MCAASSRTLGAIVELACRQPPTCAFAQGPIGRQAASALLYNGTDASLMRWHRGMAVLMGWIETRTPVGEVAEVIGERKPCSTMDMLSTCLTLMTTGALTSC